MLRNNDPTTIVGRTDVAGNSKNQRNATDCRSGGNARQVRGKNVGEEEEKERVTPKELGCREKRVGEVFPLF